MAVNLVKGQRISIGLSKLEVVLGWKTEPGKGYDLDVSSFLLGLNGKALSDKNFVFYGSEDKITINGEVRPISPCKGVIGAVDDLGENDEDEDDDGVGQEDVQIDLNKVDPRVMEIIIVVTIYEHDTRKQNFGQVRDSRIQIIDKASNNIIAVYELDEDFSTETSVEFGRLYRKGTEWKFEAIGKGYNEGLDYLVKKYGLTVA